MNEKTKKIVNISISVVLTVLIIFILAFTVFSFNMKKNGGIPNVFGKGYLTVRSDSMNVVLEEFNSKGFKKGDIIVIERYNWVEAQNKRFKVGDIITFEWKDEDGNQTFNTHRIVSVNEADQYYITQGDMAYSKGLSQDPFAPDPQAEQVYFHEVVGSYQKTIRWVGNIFLFFETPAGFLIFIVLPLLALFIFEIFNFKKVYVEYRNEKRGFVPELSDAEKLKLEIERLKEELAKKSSSEDSPSNE